jgi:hypothetical protein
MTFSASFSLLSTLLPLLYLHLLLYTLILLYLYTLALLPPLYLLFIAACVLSYSVYNTPR